MRWDTSRVPARERVTGHGEALRVQTPGDTDGHHPPRRRVGLLESGRIAGLRRTVVLGEHDRGLGTDGELADQAVMGPGVAEDPPRAVDV
ncbi:MAG: hypothetical protein QOE59_5245, partial [Actinomycetota bacterium]|nr:hypothetical protein [Actinomycetota bacterium]